jgi:hypothetical protein
MAERELTFKFTAEGLDQVLQRLQELERQLTQVNQQASSSTGGMPSATVPPPPTSAGAPPVPAAGGALAGTRQATQQGTPAPVQIMPGMTAYPAGSGWEVQMPTGQRVPVGTWQELRQFAGFFGVSLPPAPAPGTGLSTQPSFDPGMVSSIGVERYWQEFAAGRTSLDFLSWQQAQFRQWVASGGVGSFADYLAVGPMRPGMQALQFLARVGGGAALLSAVGGLASSGAGFLGQALVGAETHWQNLVGSNIANALVVLGGAIGLGVGGPLGALAGAGLGYVGGALLQPLLQPSFERGLRLDVIEDLRRATGLRLGYAASPWSPTVQNLIAALGMAGIPLGGWAAQQVEMLPATLREPYAQAMLRYAADPFLFGLYGAGFMQSPDARTLLIGGALAAGDYLSPLVALDPYGWPRAVAQRHARARAEAMLIQPRIDVASTAFGYALQFGGTAAARDVLPSYQQNIQSLISALQAQRSVSMHPLEQAQLDAQIYQLQMQAQYAVPSMFVQTRLGEIQAFGGERLTTVQLAFQAAQLGGTPVQQMPFAELSGAMRELASELRRFLRESATWLSPAQQASIRAQIAQMEFQAGPALQAQRTAMILSQTGAEFGRALAELQAGTVLPTLLGAPEARLGVAQQQAVLAAQRAAQLRQQATLAGIDYATRQSLLAAAAQLEAQAQQAGIGGMLGFVGEMTGVAGGLWQMQAGAAQIALLQGVGGREAIPLMQQIVGAAAGQVGVAQWQLQQLQALGMSPLNPQFVAAQRGLLAAQLGLEQARLQTAVVPMSAQMREQFSNVQTALGVATTTFAGYADIRGLLGAELGLIQRRIAEIQAMPPADTPAVQAARTQEINQLVLQAAAVQQQLEMGWMDRLISQVWNAPGSFNLVASGFTRREASLFYGVLNRAFGGSAAASDFWRREVPAFYTSLIGRTGTPAGFMETAMLPRIEGNLNVRIIVEQPGSAPVTRVERVQLRDSTVLDYNLTPIMIRGGGSRQ